MSQISWGRNTSGSLKIFSISSETFFGKPGFDKIPMAFMDRIFRVVIIFAMLLGVNFEAAADFLLLTAPKPKDQAPGHRISALNTIRQREKVLEKVKLN